MLVEKTIDLLCLRPRFFIRLSSIVLLATACLSGQPAHVPVKRAFTHDRDLETSFRWLYRPKWNGAQLVGYDQNHTGGPIIYTIDRDGRRVETLFTLQDGALIHLYDIAASKDGEIVIVGSALTADKRGASFLARIASDRTSQVITRLWPYGAFAVTFAADGSVWTIGMLKDENGGEVARNVLRHFDSTGKMIATRTLQVKGSETAATSFLSASKDRIGWFTLGGEYLEFSLDGWEIGRYEGPEGAEPRDITGVVLNDDNDVIAGRFGKDKAEFVVLDRDRHAWTPVELPKEYATTWARVIGFDGATLVTYSQSGKLRMFKVK
jgi:hypothetical protein